VTKLQSATQDLMGKTPRLVLAMNRCICCDVKVMCCTISCCDIAGDETATNGSQSASVTCMFAYMIKNWHVWACRFATQSVTRWGTGGVFVYRIKMGHSFSSQLERCGDQWKVASYL